MLFSFSPDTPPHHVPVHLPRPLYTSQCYNVSVLIGSTRSYPCVTSAYISSLYTVQCYSVRTISRVSSPCIPVQILFLRTISTPYKHLSTTPRIVHSFARHSLDFNTYMSTVMQYTTRYLPTGTAFASNLHTPHRLVLTPPWSQPLSTGTHFPGNELESLHDYAKYT